MVDGTEYKQFILNVCDKRCDTLGETVRQRVLGAVSDLHAADARCHNACRSKFISERNIGYSGGKPNKSIQDSAFQDVCSKMLENPHKTWNSVELFAVYVEAGGSSISRKTLFNKLSEHFRETVVILSSPGFANVMGFRKELGKSLNLVKNTDDDLEQAVNTVASQISLECLAHKKKRDRYNINIDKQLANESVSDTVALLLTKISNKFNDSLSQVLIGNIITSVVCCQPTDLQVALGILMRRNKGLISELYKYSVCCSYDEIRLFRYSAAVYVANNYAEVGFGMSGADNLIHCIYDNFDCEISSPNCKTCCHCLAMIMAQVRLPGSDSQIIGTKKTIPRQRMEDRSKPVKYDTMEVKYDGPKKPPMPPNIALNRVPSLWFLAKQNITQHRAFESDLAFFQDVITDSKCPEYNGYNTKSCREAGMTPLPKTDVSFLPLIDHTPADPDTIKTATEKGLSLIKKSNGDVLFITCDQQLYKVTIDILFHEPAYFNCVVPILGGMHMLMNFIHAVAVIMGGSGLKEVLAGTFGSVDKMLSGKKYPQNFRALRMVAEELHRSVILEEGVSSFSGLMAALDRHAARSRTAKLWKDNLIKPSIIMMSFSRAAHEGDWVLHISAAEAMLPYFHAAGCHNYARYGQFYTHHMRGLGTKLMKKLQKGAFVRHIPGIYNSTWTDMLIETTYMRLGHGPAGAVGLATDWNQMVVWALSFAMCGELSRDVLSMSSENTERVQTHHKEESLTRIKNDQVDRQNIRDTLNMCIDPFDEASHPDGALMNIVTGEMTHPDVTADEALSIGHSQMVAFKSGWPETFYNKVSMNVVTMDSKKKHITIGQEKVYDQELIYARVIGLLVSSRDINFDDVISCELAAYPPSMFTSDGYLKTAKSKSALKKSMQVTISERSSPIPDTVIYDVSALLWVIEWPSEKVQLSVYIRAFQVFVYEALQLANVTLVFDRYYEDSIKTSTRRQRAGSSRVHNLKPGMPTPPKQVILSVTKNKIQLNAMLVEGLLDPSFYQGATQKHSMIIAGVADTPIEIFHGIRKDLQNLRSSHEEADLIIIQHAVSASILGQAVRVVCDDTDVFVLLVHYYNSVCGNQSAMIMSSPKSHREVIDIRATAARHNDIAKDLLAIHGLSGADTVASLHGIGKGTVLKVAKKGNFTLASIGDVNACMEVVLSQATKFMCAVYGKVAEACASMTECRVLMWKQKTGKSGASSPKLCSLPPTSEAFLENVRRCHLQVAIWRSALEVSPPQMDPCKFGWELDQQGVLIPCTVSAGTNLAPPFVLKLIRCNCKTSSCQTANCSCSRIGCTIFCLCGGRESCRNPLTHDRYQSDEEDEADVTVTDAE